MFLQIYILLLFKTINEKAALYLCSKYVGKPNQIRVRSNLMRAMDLQENINE